MRYSRRTAEPVLGAQMVGESHGAGEVDEVDPVDEVESVDQAEAMEALKSCTGVQENACAGLSA